MTAKARSNMIAFIVYVIGAALVLSFVGCALFQLPLDQ